MKLLQLAAALTLLNSLGLAETKNIPEGWSLNGIGLSENSLNTSSVSSSIGSIWKYTSNGWAAYSPDVNMQNTLKNAGIETLDSLEPGDGFWINSKEETTLSTSTKNAKVMVSNFSLETDLSSSENKDYTYNYVQGSGVALSEYIDWDNAVSLSQAPEDTSLAKVLSKAIPKVFQSSSKSHMLVVNSFECGSNDYTLAITPYQSDGSIPGTSQNHWNKEIPLNFDIYIPSTQSSTGLNTYSNGNSYTINTPIRELSVDISLSDSNGDRLSLEDSKDACSVNAYMIYTLDDTTLSQSILNGNNSYSLHEVTGYNEFNNINTTLSLTQGSSANKIVTNDIITSFSPHVLTSTKSVKEFMIYDTSLNFTSTPFLMVRYPLINNNISYGVTSISNSSLPGYSSFSQKLSNNNLEIVKSFEISFNGLSNDELEEFSPTLYFYFINEDMKQYKLYGYNGSSYIPILADQTSQDEKLGKTIYHSGPYSSSQMKIVLAKPTTLNNQTYIGTWNQYSTSSCDANGGVLEMTVKSNAVFATAVVGDNILAASGMPVSGNSFTGYTADGTAWEGTISGDTIQGQFSDFEGCFGSFSTTK